MFALLVPPAGPGGAHDEKVNSIVDDQASGFLKWTVIAVLGAAAFIIVIDTTIMNVSISVVVADLNTTVTGVQTAITLYALVMASFMITGGKLGGILGRRRTFIIGTILFAIGSGITAISQNIAMLIIGWSVIEGLGSALMLPSVWSLVTSSYKGKDRALAIAVIGGVIGAGTALGPIIGGWITSSWGWRWAFVFEVVIAALVVGLAFLIKKQPVKEKPRLDLVGIVLSVVGVAMVVLGVLQSSNWGLVKAKSGAPFDIFGLSPTLLLVLAGLVVLAFFAFWQKRVDRSGGEPLIDLSLFRDRTISAGLSTYTTLMIVQLGLLFTIPLFMQKVLVLDALQTGIGLLPLSIALLLASLASPRFARRLFPKSIVMAGMMLLAAGCFLLSFGTPKVVTSADMILGLAIVGLGLGLVAPQLNNLVLSSAPKKNVDDASALVSTFGQLGNAIGTALLGAVLITALGVGIQSYLPESKVLTPGQQDQIAEAVKEDVEIVSNTELEVKLEGQPEEIKDEVIWINTEANKDAFGITLFSAGIISLLGLCIALLLPRVKLQDLGTADEPGLPLASRGCKQLPVI